MKEKKHIDQLFKERFEQFEPTPSPRVWENIQSQLAAKKQDRKVIPLWWRLGGVAALLALLLLVGSVFFSSSELNNTVVTSEGKETLEVSDPNNTFQPSKKVPNKSSVASEEVVTEEESLFNQPATSKEVPAVISSENASDKSSKQNTPTKNYTRIASEEKATKHLNSATETASEDINKVQTTRPQSSITNNEAVAVENTSKSNASSKINESKKEAVSTNKEFSNKEIGVTETTPIAEASQSNNETKTKTNKKSLIEEIEKTKKEEEAVAIKNTPTQRWNVAPNIAPVYYSSLGNGSSVDPMFEDNSQGGNTSISYGVNISYNITDRLSVRSGISNVDLSYSTNDVVAAEGPGSVALRGVNHNGNTNIITAFDKGNVPTSNGAEGFGMIIPKAGGAIGELNQDISYFEVPLELKYALLNKRFGINVIGGFSTLFLGNNEVSVRSGDFESVLGEANNLSSVSFTSNVGLGFGYSISKKFKFNIEPMFKYQLNPYTDSSVNFKPYYVGIYSGLSIQF
ncbi:outer membrane beta-barrel protein [Cochleicola gelatinilyticus]|uniref:Uncharacterized protein n=1 Tax=Cochleicola gelatinilyticus TaxID=1763537 RepID=A0A167J026_9FLAO|nr:outer membrane beta-barrel protein [Cochleicola gelatinilyticus]OAB80187.1 hypothetical protein ULVI_05470 [Cochleicola gelatinilyticus]